MNLNETASTMPPDRRLISQAKTGLLDAFANASLINVAVTFNCADGCGSITHIRARRQGEQDMDSIDLRTVPLGPGRRDSLYSLLVSFTWHVVNDCHPGSLDDEGAKGTLEVDVERRTFSLRHHKRQPVSDGTFHRI